MAELCRTLEREAAAESERLLGDARAEAERIRGQAEARRHEERNRDLAAAEAAARAGAESRLVAVNQAARRRSLEAERLLVDRVLAAAALLLGNAVARPNVLGALIEAALAYADGPAILRCPPELAGAVRAHVEGRAGITVEAAGDARSGVSAILRGGAVSVDATLEGRLERIRPALAIDVVKRLDDVG